MLQYLTKARKTLIGFGSGTLAGAVGGFVSSLSGGATDLDYEKIAEKLSCCYMEFCQKVPHNFVYSCNIDFDSQFWLGCLQELNQTALNNLCKAILYFDGAPTTVNWRLFLEITGALAATGLLIGAFFDLNLHQKSYDFLRRKCTKGEYQEVDGDLAVNVTETNIQADNPISTLS